MNLYAYCGNRPLQFVDPLGLTVTDEALWARSEQARPLTPGQEQFVQDVGSVARGVFDFAWGMVQWAYKATDIENGGTLEAAADLITGPYHAGNGIYTAATGERVSVWGSPTGEQATRDERIRLGTQGALTVGLLFVAESGAAGRSGIASDTGVGVLTDVVRIPDNPSIRGHIFREAENHLCEDTPCNVELFERVANDPQSSCRINEFGTTEIRQTLPDGCQVWVDVRGGEIRNAGVNPPSSGPSSQ